MAEILIKGERIELPRIGEAYIDIRIYETGEIVVDGDQDKTAKVVALPEHGRLGDLDALAEHIMNVYCTNCKRSKVMCKACEYGDMIDEIDNAPVILEATE